MPRQAAEPSGLVVLFLLRKRPEVERFGGLVVWLFCYLYHGLTPETQGRRGMTRGGGRAGVDKRRREGMSGEEAKGEHEWRRGERRGKGAVATCFAA